MRERCLTWIGERDRHSDAAIPPDARPFAVTALLSGYEPKNRADRYPSSPTQGHRPMTDWMLVEIAKVRTVIEAGVVILAVFTVAGTWLRTRQLVATLGAVLFGVFAIWAVRNVDTLAELVGREFTATALTTQLGRIGR